MESGAEWAAQDLRNRVKAAMGNNEKQKEEIHQARKEAFQKHEEQFQKQEQQERFDFECWTKCFQSELWTL